MVCFFWGVFFGSKMINNHSPNLLLSNKYLMLANSYEFRQLSLYLTLCSPTRELGWSCQLLLELRVRGNGELFNVHTRQQHFLLKYLPRPVFPLLRWS